MLRLFPFRTVTVLMLVVLLVRAVQAAPATMILATLIPTTPLPVAPAPACTPLRTDAWIGVSHAQAVAVVRQPLPAAVQARLPGGSRPGGTPPFQGTLFWPAEDEAAPWPAVVLLHGSGGTQCDLFTDARALAARGYVTLTLTQPDNRSGSSEASGVQALLSALNFLKSAANPVLARTRPDDVALVGHSEGAGVVSIAQGLPGFGGVRAVVALDNLRRWLIGDPGAAVRSCARPPAYEVTPRVPALGFAKDAPCTESGDRSPDLKLGAWRFWQASGVPAVELVPAGYGHLTFTDRKATGAQLQMQAALIGAWLDRWLRQDQGALNAFTCAGPLSPAFLSTQYRSALFVPGLPAVSDLRASLSMCPPGGH